MIVLLVDKFDNRPRRVKGFDRIVSCGQYPSSLDGLAPTEVHVTEEATQHRRFPLVASTLAHAMERRRR